jgi:hypothetical protein
MGLFDKLKERIGRKKSKETIDPQIASMMEFAKHRQEIEDADFDKYCISKFGSKDSITTYKNGFEGPVHYMDKDGYANVSYEYTQMEELYRDGGEHEVTHPERGRFVYMNDNKDGYEVVRLTHADIVELQNILGLSSDKETATPEKEGM